ncbi:hypothetical protein E0G79_21795 [Salmonella enterica]|nr:hypothetical protein [Salmonella enterica]EBA9765171.1 hypothetical protein [Salmonella enterica]EEB5698905.1 hypothetical protein [Salmonella enterica]EGX5147328.1 hypothetical protein [Salmonella enterica]EHQ9355011.1 hypothetical protein [Salmonella enterica]
MRQHNGVLAGLALAGMIMLSGCANKNVVSKPVTVSPGVSQGMLGDLNQYVYQLLGQQKAGNADAGKVLIRLLSGKGLPEPVTVTRRQ